MIAIDTNVLVYAISAEDPHHVPSRALLEAVAEGIVPAVVFPQNLLEFYATVTNPRLVVRTLTSHEALAEISNFRAILRVICPKESSLDCLPEVVVSSCIAGSDVFDAFIAAQMQDAGIGVICTYNTRDFLPYPISAATPEEVLDSFGIRRDRAGFVHDRPNTK